MASIAAITGFNVNNSFINKHISDSGRIRFNYFDDVPELEEDELFEEPPEDPEESFDDELPEEDEGELLSADAAFL
jgi:hypothetical protein